MIPEELKTHRQWVCAQGDSKIPYNARTGFPASVNDPSTWSTYEEAERVVKNGLFDYVGYVFNANGIVGIDIDKGYVDEHEISTMALNVICRCSSYTEKSKSGRGFHILLKGDLPFKGMNNRNGIEIYKTGRYFILTGEEIFNKLPNTIQENQPAIDWLLENYFNQKTRKSEIQPRIYNPEWDTKPVSGKIPVRPKYPLITEGSRNTCLTSLAGLLRSQGYDRKTIYNELLYANDTACKPKLSVREIQNIVTSVMRYKP